MNRRLRLLFSVGLVTSAWSALAGCASNSAERAPEESAPEVVVGKHPAVTKALKAAGVSKMSVEVSATEVAIQGVGTVPFDQAVTKAVDLFLTDPMGLPIDVVPDDLDDAVLTQLKAKCGPSADLVRCVANAPEAKIRLWKSADGAAPEGETVAGSWIFRFTVEGFTDHAFFAVIDKAGVKDAYVYASN